MKITLESTSKIVTLTTGTGDVQARIWEGRTESGIEVHAFITRVAVNRNEDCSQFETELKECRTPLNPDIQAYPARIIL